MQQNECIPDNSDNTTCTYTDVFNDSELLSQIRKLKQNFTSIKRINFVDCYFVKIPKEIFEIYPNVEVIDASYASLESLDFLEGINKIQMINASENHIKIIDPRINERSVSDLETLDFSHNRISTIIPHTFEGSYKLKHLNLSHNQLTIIDSKLLTSIKNLEVLNLDHNQIKQIRCDFKDFKPNWKELYLQNNQLKILDTSLVKSVLILDISHNNISEAKFHDSKMIELMIQNNNLTILTIGENLEKLDASFNKRDSFNFELNDNTKLRHLNLADSHIKLKEKEMKTVMNFTRLQYLNLNYASSSNGFLHLEMLKDFKELETLKLRKFLSSADKLSENTFGGMTKLIELDLSRNYFKELDLNVLNASKNLEILNLRDCAAHQITGWRNLRTLFPKLKNIDFYLNWLSCNETKEMIEDLKKEGIEIIDLELLGEEKFLEKNCRIYSDEDYDEEDYDDEDYKNTQKHDKKGKKDETEKSGHAWWIIATIFIICVVIGGLVYVIRKFDIFTNKTTQNHSEEFVGIEI